MKIKNAIILGAGFGKKNVSNHKKNSKTKVKINNKTIVKPV